MDVLESRIRATVIQAAILALLALCLGGFTVLVAGWMALTAQGLGKAALVGVFGLLMFLAVWAFVDTVRTHTPAKKSPIYRAYETQPSPVGWVYQKVGRSAGLHVVLLDGSSLTLAAGRKHIEALFLLTRERAPQAILGYGTAQEKAFLERKKAARAGSAPPT